MFFKSITNNIFFIVAIAVLSAVVIHVINFTPYNREDRSYEDKKTGLASMTGSKSKKKNISNEKDKDDNDTNTDGGDDDKKTDEKFSSLAPITIIKSALFFSSLKDTNEPPYFCIAEK